MIFSKKYNIISKHSGKVRNRRRGVREVYSAILERSCAERHRRFKSCSLRQTTALAQSRNRKEKPNCFSFSFSSILPRLRYAPECGHRPRDASLCYAIPSRFALLTNPFLSAKNNLKRISRFRLFFMSLSAVFFALKPLTITSKPGGNLKIMPF